MTTLNDLKNYITANRSYCIDDLAGEVKERFGVRRMADLAPVADEALRFAENRVAYFRAMTAGQMTLGQAIPEYMNQIGETSSLLRIQLFGRLVHHRGYEYWATMTVPEAVEAIAEIADGNPWKYAYQEVETACSGTTAPSSITKSTIYRA